MDSNIERWYSMKEICPQQKSDAFGNSKSVKLTLG